MSDVNRLTVDCFVLHHAVTPLWQEKSKPQLAQWFSDNGFARAYGSNSANWSGLINPYTGGRSYSQAHIAGQQVNDSTPDATAEERAMGYRWVQLVDDIYGQITWHAGNWNMNCRSIGIENLGDYRNYTLRDKDAQVLGAFWRPQDLRLSGATSIYGHKEVSDAVTECPARIMEMRGAVVDYCNNPPVIVPPTPPVPVTLPVPNAIALPNVIHFLANATKTEVWDLTTNPNYKSVKTLNKGDEFDAVGYIPFNGIKYYVTDYTFSKGLKTGVNEGDLIVKPVIIPPVIVPPVIIPPVTPVEPPVEPVEPKPEPEPTQPPEPTTEPTEQPVVVKKQNFFTWLFNWIIKQLNKGNK